MVWFDWLSVKPSVTRLGLFPHPLGDATHCQQRRKEIKVALDPSQHHSKRPSWGLKPRFAVPVAVLFDSFACIFFCFLFAFCSCICAVCFSYCYLIFVHFRFVGFVCFDFSLSVVYSLVLAKLKKKRNRVLMQRPNTFWCFQLIYLFGCLVPASEHGWHANDSRRRRRD